MIIRAENPNQFVIELDRDELVVLNNALNEACDAIDDREFSTRLGISREAAESLLDQINQALS